MVEEMSQSYHPVGTKWRGTWRDIHIDLHVPFQSRLGAKLQLRVEALVPYPELAEGRRLLSVPAQVATEVAALLDRPDSLPGRKDRQELLNLLARPDASGAAAVIKAASARTSGQIGVLGDDIPGLGSQPQPAGSQLAPPDDQAVEASG